MRIVQAVFGVFHHFELARELERRGHLEKIYSTWPWQRLKREGLPRTKVETFPWLHTPDILLTRANLNPVWLSDHLGYTNALVFDRWTDRRMPPCDALVAISGAGLRTGVHLQQRGGVFICDRGSSHIRYQYDVLTEEYQRWRVDYPAADIRDIRREEEIYHKADAVTVPSIFAARSFVEMGVPADKVHNIPYGVLLESFRRTAEPAADSFEVIFAGGIGLRKGVPYLLEAFSRLKHPAKRLRFVGDVLPDLKPVLGRLPLDRVEFAGSVPQSRLAEMMSASHVLVLPSIEEGFGMVMNQAMACGCPVIASNHTGALDVIQDGSNGFIVPIRDVDAIRDRLQQLADDPDLQRTMGANALASVKSAGGWQQYGDGWENLLHQLTGKP